MKRFLQWLALTVAVCSISSCGLPGALARSAGNTVSSLSNAASSMVSQ